MDGQKNNLSKFKTFVHLTATKIYFHFFMLYFHQH